MRKKTLFTVCLCSGLMTASVSLIAQTANEGSGSSNNSGTPPSSQQYDTTKSLDQRQRGLSDGSNRAKESHDKAFRRFDSQRRGYLMADDLRDTEGFNSSNCDRNNDGRITRSEFRTCWSNNDNWSNRSSMDNDSSSNRSSPRSGGGRGINQ